jgi:hypothetical protein
MAAVAPPPCVAGGGAGGRGRQARPPAGPAGARGRAGRGARLQRGRPHRGLRAGQQPGRAGGTAAGGPRLRRGADARRHEPGAHRNPPTCSVRACHSRGLPGHRATNMAQWCCGGLRLMQLFPTCCTAGAARGGAAVLPLRRGLRAGGHGHRLARPEFPGRRPRDQLRRARLGAPSAHTCVPARAAAFRPHPLTSPLLHPARSSTPTSTRWAEQDVAAAVGWRRRWSQPGTVRRRHGWWRRCSARARRPRPGCSAWQRMQLSASVHRLRARAAFGGRWSPWTKRRRRRTKQPHPPAWVTFSRQCRSRQMAGSTWLLAGLGLRRSLRVEQ